MAYFELLTRNLPEATIENQATSLESRSPDQNL